MSDSDADDEINPTSSDPLVRKVGRALIESGLGSGASLFAPPRTVWSPETVSELHRYYNERLDMGSDTFLVKLRRQLDGASDEAILLAAELLTLHALPLANFTAASKRSRVQEVLNWMGEPIPIPAEVNAAFEQGSWNGGIGTHTMIWKWLADAVAFVQMWWSVPAAQRSQALTDPWVWLEVVHGIPTMPSFRELLLYLGFPGYFLPIISLKHKAAIREAYRYRLSQSSGDLDRDLYRIMLSLQAEAGEPVELYDTPYIDEWQPKTGKKGEQRAWLIRPGTGAQALVERWKQEGFVSLAGTHLAELAPGTNLPDVRAAVEAGYQHLDYAQRVALANEYYAFLSRMSEGDIVATIAGDKLSVGTVTGTAAYDASGQGARLRRPVTWQDAEPAAVGTLPAPLPAELDQQGMVVDLTGALDVLAGLLGEDAPETGHKEPSEEPSEPAVKPALRTATADLARSLSVNQQWLQEVIDLLHDRQQIIFYGPPGTGKTFLAQEIAQHIAERGSSQLVQFHPSYSYEDFFEGYRPTGTSERGVGFTLTPGPLRRIAAQARANPGKPYVLIVDEINRANLAKVFGELYFLLEYRGKSITLQYSPSEAFSLPPNLFFIGTMNTADRSIALLDAAIRRRFAFVELHPDDPPIRDLLATWLNASHKDGDQRAGLLQALNSAIGEEDRDFKIGPSYLMRPEAGTSGGLERVWRHDLLPLLEEHYYGRLTRSQVRERFGLATIRRTLAVHSLRNEAADVAAPTGESHGSAGEPAAADASEP